MSNAATISQRAAVMANDSRCAANAARNASAHGTFDYSVLAIKFACHRALRKHGALVDSLSGIDRKRSLLAREAQVA